MQEEDPEETQDPEEEADDTSQPTPREIRSLIKVVKEVVSEIENLGGDVSRIKDELKSAKKELSSIKEELKRARRNSNRDFTPPNITGNRANSKPFDPDKELERFGIK